MQPCADCINDASGVEPKAAPGGQDGRICGMSDGEIGAGEPGGGEPSRRLSGGRCGRSRRQSCAARCRRRGRKCPHWCGHDCTARCGAKCGRAPQERPHECSERCAKRRREQNAAVVPTMPSNAAPTVAVRHAAVSEASRRASGARSDRRERRREGYPPEGARPRSGLDRVARSRSDAPRLIVWLTALQLFAENEEIAEAAVKAAETAPAEPIELKEKPRRKPLPDHLERIEQVLSVGEDCPECGGDLSKPGEDITEELEYIPGRFVVNKITRPRMACRRCEAISQAPMPSRPIERGRPGPGLLAHVLVSRFADHRVS